ncbi:MAG: hypothetical protein ACTSPB_01415 [Candidatus Thorarchaeota archaeon]
MGKKRKNPKPHTVHTKHPRYNVPKYSRGSGTVLNKDSISQEVSDSSSEVGVRYLKPPEERNPYSPFYTMQKCRKCGYRGYAEEFKGTMRLTCPKCGARGYIDILN